MLRTWLRQLHLYSALISALVISIVGVTGSIYVFEPELSAWLQRDYYSSSGKTLYTDDTAIVQAIEQHTGGKLQSLQWPQRARETYAFKLFEDDSWYFFDQGSGKVSSNNGAFSHPLLDLILQLHTNLLLGEPGRYITATASLIFALTSLMTGIYLWWPRTVSRLKKAFIVHRSNPKRFNFDLHAVSGTWFSIPLLIMALTGAYFLYTEPLQKVVDWVTLSEPAPADIWNNEIQYSVPELPMLTATEAISHIAQHNPGLYPRNIWLTDDPNGTIYAGYQASKQLETGAQYRVFLQLNPYDGSVLGSYDPATLPRGAALMANWLLPLHFGEFGGILTRLIWFIGGLLPMLLTITGIRIWLARKRLW